MSVQSRNRGLKQSVNGPATLTPILSGGRVRGIACAVGLGCLEGAAAGVAAFATRDVFRLLHAGTPGPGTQMPVVQALAMLAAAGVAIALIRICIRALGEDIGQSYAISLRRDLYRHLARMPVKAHSARRVGALGLRYVGDLSAARLWISQGIVKLLVAAILIPGAALALAMINPDLALAAFVPLVVCVGLMIAVSTLLEPLHRRLRARRARIAIAMIERAGLAPELDLIGRTRAELAKLRRDGDLLRSAAVRRATAAGGLRAVPEIGAAAGGIAVLFMAWRTGAAPAEAAAALAVLAILTQPLRDLAGVWDRRCAWRIAAGKLEDVLCAPARPFHRGDMRRSVRKAAQDPPGAGAPGIVFKAVSAPPLAAFSASVQPGQTIGVTGPAGTGKSTLLNLVAGLDMPEDGDIRFFRPESSNPEGSNPEDTSPKDSSGDTDGPDGGPGGSTNGRGPAVYRIARIGAPATLVQGSLRKALALAVSPRPDDAVIEAVARRFGLAGLIARLGGLDGRVSEAGRNLSSGEICRIQMARAALQQADVLLIDGIDADLDADVRAHLADLIALCGATTLIATRDAGLLALCRQVWTLDGRDIDGRTDGRHRRDGVAMRWQA